MKAETRKLLEMVSQASGETIDDIMSKQRRRPLPACRWLVARELVRRGYSKDYASHQVNITHASLLHGTFMLDVMVQHPRNGYAEEVHIERRFNAALQDSKMVLYGSDSQAVRK